ncbi:TonB-dependent receptor [Pseudoduganella sp. LjRoot289]|uniref:TonB-dependent receptor plug domain-containing protein n=1 Tax=Pseudoduganella sp. LjRoot289 TaxID=3342314 RepID=UPI003ECF05A1
MTKATAIHIAVLLLCSSIAAAQNVPAQGAPEAGSEEIQKVVVVSTGSRGSQRTVIDSAVPIDILPSKELGKTGQNSLDKALGFRVPSFNTVQTPVNDATSLLDPYEIRNMGPSRSLILINGKRKNSSALLYTNTSPGRGESGSDISAIPVDAIKRIEVLRDGASAQYGSDAISGVVNIILKDSPNEGSLTLRAGMTGESDGKMGGASFNHGISLGGKGFLNYTVDVSKIGLARRSGLVDGRGEASDFGATLAEVNAFLAQFPDAGNINGSPETEASKFLVNTQYNFSDGFSVYGNAAYIKKDVNSNANYRTPYWRPTDYGKLHAAGTPYLGYMPDFIGALDDYNGTVGTKLDLKSWEIDLSATTGGNKQTYNVNHSLNRSMGAASPTSFYAGGSEFTHFVVNGDVTKRLNDKTRIYFGTELRWEEFETLAGDLASYQGGGADSFAGNMPENSFKSKRNNKGIYFGTEYDISSGLLVDATGRFEHYSDFGNAFVWKVMSRLKISDAVTLRGSASTSFRAPSLHQIYTQKAQYSFVAGQGIQVSGLVNNVSPQARALGVPLLDAEKSRNFTIGLGVKPDNNTSFTLDYYNIRLKDRIVLGNDIGPSGDPTNPLDRELAAAGIVQLSFFTNALDSSTSGLDYVFSRRNLPLLGGKLAVNFSGNYTLKNERDGAVRNTPLVASAGQSVIDATQEALMFTSRPKHKTLLGLDLDYNKFNFSLNNTVFGPTEFRNAGLDSNLAVKFKTKTVTDFAVNYSITDKMTLTFNVNNVFDVTPKWKLHARNSAGQAILDSTTRDAYGATPSEVQSNLITFNGRYSMVTYDGSHFSQLGRIFNASLNYRF